MTKPRIAVIVGHTKERPGALAVWPLTPLDQPPVHEFNYNLQLAEIIAMDLIARGADCQCFLRREGREELYARVNMFYPDCSVELHFNAFDQKARGTLTLYGQSHAKSEDLARHLQNAMIAALERDEHTNRGIHLMQKDDTGYSRGYSNVNLAEKPACLVEPFFGDNVDDARLAMTRQGQLGSALALALWTFASPVDILP